MTDSPRDDLPVDEDRLADRLTEERPVPSSRFVASLGSRIADLDPGWGPRPERLWPQALAMILSGAIILLLGALICVGGL